MDPKIPVGTDVFVKINGKQGNIIGVLESLEGHVEYDVRSVDGNGTIDRSWFVRSELEVIEKKA